MDPLTPRIRDSEFEVRKVPRVSGAIPRAIVLLLAAARLTVAQSQTIKVGGRDVAVWRPADGKGIAPVIIFSHGFGGCATQSRFLTDALANRGYWVFAPNHKDARCGQSGGRGSARGPDEPFREPEKWSESSFADRRDDVRAIIGLISTDTTYSKHIDLARVGLVGHSLGGYTVLGLAGGWPSWKQAGVKAVLALSPYVDPFIVHHTLGGVSAPVMYQGGTLDFGITPSLHRPDGAYDASPTPKYLVVLTGAGHFAWTNLRADAHERILDYGIAFLDHYVRGMPASSALTRMENGISDFRYQSELGTRAAEGRARGKR